MDKIHFLIDIGKERKKQEKISSLWIERKQMHAQSKVSQLQWASSVASNVGGCWSKPPTAHHTNLALHSCLVIKLFCWVIKSKSKQDLYNKTFIFCIFQIQIPSGLTLEPCTVLCRTVVSFNLWDESRHCLTSLLSVKAWENVFLWVTLLRHTIVHLSLASEVP